MAVKRCLCLLQTLYSLIVLVMQRVKTRPCAHHGSCQLTLNGWRHEVASTPVVNGLQQAPSAKPQSARPRHRQPKVPWPIAFPNPHAACPPCNPFLQFPASYSPTTETHTLFSRCRLDIAPRPSRGFLLAIRLHCSSDSLCLILDRAYSVPTVALCGQWLKKSLQIRPSSPTLELSRVAIPCPMAFVCPTFYAEWTCSPVSTLVIVQASHASWLSTPRWNRWPLGLPSPDR